MGLMKKAAAALSFRDSDKSRTPSENAPALHQPQPFGHISAPQQDPELPADFRLSLAFNDSTTSPAFPVPDIPLWASRSSADGRLLGATLASSLRNMGLVLESPGASSTGTLTGPTCTGGGHGEAPPSVAGFNPRQHTPALRQSISNTQQPASPPCNATATPLARQVATRALRKAGDSAPITLPSITSLTGGTRLRDAAPPPIQLQGAAVAADSDTSGGGGDSAATSPPASPSASGSPRPPALSPSSGLGPSPRMRRSTTLGTQVESAACQYGQYVAVSATAAAAAVPGGVAASPLAISAPWADMPTGGGGGGGGGGGPLGLGHQPLAPTNERFSRVSSLQMQMHGIPYNAGEVLDACGGAGTSGASRGCSSAVATVATEADAGCHIANSTPLCALRFNDCMSQQQQQQQQQQSTVASTASTVATAATFSWNPTFRVTFASRDGTTTPLTSAGGGSSSSSPRHASTSQLQLRQYNQLPYNPQQTRLPPTCNSDYSMSAVPADSALLPKLKSPMASITASAAAAVASAAAPTAPSASALQKVPDAAAAPPLLTAAVITAGPVVEGCAVATATIAAAEPRAVRHRAMRCINLEPLRPPAGHAADDDGDCTIVASNSGAVVSGGGSVTASRVGDWPSGAANAAEDDIASPMKQPQQEPSSQPSRPPQTPRAGNTGTTRPSPVASYATSVSPFAKAASAAESSSSVPPPPLPTTAEIKMPSQPASSSLRTAAVAAATSPRAPPAPLAAPPPRTPPQQASAPPLPPRSPLDEFVPRPMPPQGLLHFSPGAPVQMLRAPVSWGVADYKVVRKLYAGYASSVYKATCRTSGTDVVLKAYNLAGLSTFLRNQVLRELDVHSRLRHPSVVHLMAAFREGDLLVLVLDYIRGGSLDRVRRKLGGRMTEFQAMHLVLLPLLGVLSYVHDRGVVHRDIKPDNLLFTENWQLKLCDFGVSICLREERAVTRTGSREYMAPEVNICPLKRGPEDNKDNPALAYGSSVDVWSLGALMYELLVGFTPFPGGPPTRRGDGERGSAGAGLAFPSSVSQGARDFVRLCLELDPADRPTVNQLLEHAWIQEAMEYNASLEGASGAAAATKAIAPTP